MPQSRITTVLCFLLCSLLLVGASFSQCDSNLVPSTKEPKYKERGAVCEGIYQANVANPVSLDLVQFVRGNFDYALDKLEKIAVFPSSRIETSLNLRAVGKKAFMFYRMDTRIAGGDTLLWDINEVIYKMKFPARYVGIYGWLELQPEGKIYVPVRTNSRVKSVPLDEIYRIGFIASSKVHNVRWKLNDQPWKDLPGEFRSGYEIRLELRKLTTGNHRLLIEVQDFVDPDLKEVKDFEILISGKGN